MKLSYLYISIAFLLSLSSASVQAAGKGELKQSRYIGTITFPAEKLAVVADIFLESPEDLTQFPVLNAIFKISLGGYSSNEYRTEIFKNLKYDFDEGSLTFDEMKNDFVMTTVVQNSSGRSKIVGKVYVRSSATWGEIELLEESDEPEDLEFVQALKISAKPFIPALDGQYSGLCDGRSTTLQVQTARGMGERKSDSNTSMGLERDYGITGRLGFKKDSLCQGLANSKWCVRDNYTSGSYNVIAGKLNLRGEKSSMKCTRKDQETLDCQFQAFSKITNCDLKKKAAPTETAKFFPRAYNLSPSDPQSEKLPEPSPPTNAALSQALRGAFYGFIHNESNDTYLPVRLDVIPFSSTENPHNPNQMMISTTASIFFGSFNSSQFYTQRYDARSFYLRPGFMLSGTDTDSFFTISEWSQGFIRGNFYSQKFGKVGTIQLVKDTPPEIPKEMKLMSSFHGEFQRYLHEDKISQWLKLDFPGQPNDIQDNLIRFTGSYQAVFNSSPIRDIEVGFFDPLTGRFGWQLSLEDESTFGTGQVDNTQNLKIFWPPRPIFGVSVEDYELKTFQRKTGSGS